MVAWKVMCVFVCSGRIWTSVTHTHAIANMLHTLHWKWIKEGKLESATKHRAVSLSEVLCVVAAFNSEPQGNTAVKQNTPPRINTIKKPSSRTPNSGFSLQISLTASLIRKKENFSPLLVRFNVNQSAAFAFPSKNHCAVPDCSFSCEGYLFHLLIFLMNCWWAFH